MDTPVLNRSLYRRRRITNQIGMVLSSAAMAVGLIVAFVGAVVLLGIVNLVQRGRVR